ACSRDSPTDWCDGQPSGATRSTGRFRSELLCCYSCSFFSVVDLFVTGNCARLMGISAEDAENKSIFLRKFCHTGLGH
ncbi:MAG: hypothetical protein ACK55Z_14285, partial [bacterium]